MDSFRSIWKHNFISATASANASRVSSATSKRFDFADKFD